MARKRRKRRDWDKVRGVLVGIFGLILIAGLGGAAWYWTSKEPKLDEATGCPTTGPTAVHAILIDRSDPITPLQGQRIRQTVDRYVQAAKIGERFELYIADSDAVNVLTAVAAVCNPGRGDQAGELYQNPRMIQRQFEEKFLKVLHQNLDNLLMASTADSSPILESIRAVGVAAFGNVEPGTIPLQLTIVSDMVQHSGANSHFRGETNFVELSRKPAWRSLQANLKGAKVDVLYLLRADAKRNGVPIQNRGHEAFWESAIKGDEGKAYGEMVIGVTNAQKAAAATSASDVDAARRRMVQDLEESRAAVAEVQKALADTARVVAEALNAPTPAGVPLS